MGVPEALLKFKMLICRMCSVAKRITSALLANSANVWSSTLFHSKIHSAILVELLVAQGRGVFSQEVGIELGFLSFSGIMSSNRLKSNAWSCASLEAGANGLMKAKQEAMERNARRLDLEQQKQVGLPKIWKVYWGMHIYI